MRLWGGAGAGVRVCRCASVDAMEVFVQGVCAALGECWKGVCAPGSHDGRTASESEEESRETRCHTDTGDMAPSVIVYIVIQLTDHKHGGICQQTKLLFFLCSA